VARTRRVSDGGQGIAYELRGGVRRRPWLTLIQGLGLDGSGWGPAAGYLRARFRLVLLDNRGSGRDDPPPRNLTIADMVRDVVAVLDEAGIGQTRVLGASLGGMVAQELAVQHPERVSRLVLACTTPGWPLAFPMPAASALLMAALRTLPVETARRRLVENALSPQTLREHPELAERLIEHHRSRPVDSRALSAQALAGASYSGRLTQARIQAPTLVLHGGADKVIDPRNGKLLADRIPGAELVIFSQLGHLFFWEDPGRFAAAVTEFLLRPGFGT
jgi:pimeloyl-ACP methyl ester carboxylesterase